MADLGQERQEVGAGAVGGHIIERVGSCGPESEIRAARSSERYRSRSTIQGGMYEKVSGRRRAGAPA